MFTRFEWAALIGVLALCVLLLCHMGPVTV